MNFLLAVVIYNPPNDIYGEPTNRLCPALAPCNIHTDLSIPSYSSELTIIAIAIVCLALAIVIAALIICDGLTKGKS